MLEEDLRLYRDQAIRLLKENQSQTREGIEMLVRNHLDGICLAADPSGRAMTAKQVEAIYKEIVELSFLIFSLGFSMAHAVPGEPVRA